MRGVYRIEYIVYRIGSRFARIFAVALLILSAAQVQAQDFEHQYKLASDFFKEGKYNLAMTAFNPLVTYDKDNSYSEYASFYYALSAYRQNYPTVAKDMFIQMKKLYPTWEKMDEVNYWLAVIYFEQHEYFQALLTLKSLQNPSYQEDILQMKRHFLLAIDDTETLTMMLEEHPADAEVARALARAISKQPSAKQDRTQLDAVITRFNFNKDEFVSSDALIPIFKDRYRVSLLFPFLAGTLEPTVGTKVNQYVLDLYDGMKLAKDTLDKQNIHLDLLAYDTERNPDVLKKLLETDELRSSDVIVGPLFTQENAPVQEFSEKNRINMVNPVSNNQDFIGLNPFSWLYQPNHETLGAKSAEFLNAHVPNKNVIVFYGDTPKDSVMAFGFIRRAQALGMKIVLAEEYHKETSSRILTTLTTPTSLDEFKKPVDFTIKRDSIGSIFVASDESLIYAKVISSVEQRLESTVIMGNENWLTDTSMDYAKLERLNVVFASPNFTPPTNQDFLRFRKRYIQVHGVLPSSYAKLGYEFGLFMGHILSQYGVYFQNGFDKDGLIHGNLVKGYNFQQTHSNQLFSFTRFKNGELTIAE